MGLMGGTPVAAAVERGQWHYFFTAGAGTDFSNSPYGFTASYGAPSKRDPCRMTAKIAIRAIFPLCMGWAVRKIAVPVQRL